MKKPDEVEFSETIYLLIEVLKKHHIPYRAINIRGADGKETAGIMLEDCRWSSGGKLVETTTSNYQSG